MADIKLQANKMFIDPNNKGRVLDILVDFVEEEGATLITVTHDHDLLDRFDRVVDLKELLTLS